MSAKVGVLLLMLLLPLPAVIQAHAQADEIRVQTDSEVYAPGQQLLVFGTTTPDDSIVLTLRAPDNSIIKFDQVDVPEDGAFYHPLLVWSEASLTFPYGTYAIEVQSTVHPEFSRSLDVRFAPSSDLIHVPLERQISTLVFVPETAALGATLRVFVQTTSDGLLITGSPTELLDTTHVHLPNGTLETLSDDFRTIHRGLYYVDFTPQQLGTHVFHAVTFYQGTVSHGSAATTVMSQDISGISEQIIQLDTILDETSSELDNLQSEIALFGTTLEDADRAMSSSTESMSASVANVVEASLQLNSLLFPIMGSIAVIVALQIAILARHR